MNEMDILDMKPNITNDLKRIHKVITRGITITGEKAKDMMQQETLDVSYLHGYLDYVRSLTSILHSHHEAEEKLGFPTFQKKSIDAPYSLLMKGHTKMEKIITDINQAVSRLSGKNPDKKDVQHIQTSIEILDDIWAPHIQIEECNFAEPVMNGHFTAQEQQEMSMQFSQDMQQNTSPDYLIIPFVVYNLSGMDREIIHRRLPPEVTRTLIPVTWKDRWAPMKAFLLE